MVVAFPNHYSIPYRLVYLLLKRSGKWSHPDEYKIYDMKDEIDESNLKLNQRIVIAKEIVFNYWLNIYKRLKRLFLLLDKFFRFQGYLTVLIITKQ